ncbi:hypothetical protein [Agrobacterium pusense]|uniref:hypothetical protein n=1 Tax=Agrobacterium pusense TaxID=648995 RepID=UPI000D1A49D7|nr:hypothetical protein [Agrobacterium pusense]
MSFVLEKHWDRLLKEIAACEVAVREIETDLRLRAMSNDASDTMIFENVRADMHLPSPLSEQFGGFSLLIDKAVAQTVVR